MSDQALQDVRELTAEKENFRSHVGQISRHSGVFFVGTIFTVLFGYVFKVYLARVLGAEALGIYALGMTVAGLLGVFGGMGLTWAASRFPAVYCSTGRIDELRSFLAWSLVSLIAVNGVFALCIVAARHWVATSLYHTPALSGYLYLFALIMFLGSLTAFFGQLLTGYKEVTQRTLIANIGSVVLTGLFTVALVQMGTGLWGYIFAQVASAVVVLVMLVVAATRLTPPGARSIWKRIQRPSRQIFSFASAAFAMDVLVFVYSQTDKVILGFYLNARSVGIYAVAATIVGFIPIALQSVNQIFSPTIADLHARGEIAMLNRLYQILTKWILGFTWPLALVVVVFSREFMRVFGRDFESGWLILIIGAVSQLVNCGVGSVGYLLLMSGNERKLMKIQVVMGILTVICCLALVPRSGIAGAAVAAALGNIGANAWSLVEVRKVLGLFPYNRGYSNLILPASAALVATLVLRHFMNSSSHYIWIVVVATVTVYTVFLGTVLLSGLEADDRFIASAIWYRVRRMVS